MEAEMKMALQPPRDLRARTFRLVIWGLVLAMLAWAWRGAEMKPVALVEQGGNILTLISDFFPPDFTDWRMYMKEMIVTLHVAVWGTLLAVICAVPLGIMSSENIAPWWHRQPVRRLMDAARAINEMVFAMMFVVAVGLGPLPVCWPSGCTPRARWPSSFPRRWRPSRSRRWKVSAPPGPAFWKRSSSGVIPRCSPSGYRTPCTVSKPMCAPPPWWGIMG